MTQRFTIIAIALLGTSFATAQKVSKEPEVDPVLDAIQEFNRRDTKKPNEVTVVLAPEGESLAPEEKPPTPEKDTAPPKEEAVLVTGRPPEHAKQPSTPETTATVTDAADSASLSADGLSVRVEKMQNGGSPVDPSQVKLLAPFPAKPLGKTPGGWHLDVSQSAPPFTREVEITAGTKVTLKIQPHLLVPDADGSEIFSIPEPGFDQALGYRQTATVGAILSNSVRQLDEDSKRLGNAIDSLQQLLVSLPKPPEEEPQIEPATPPSRKR